VPDSEQVSENGNDALDRLRHINERFENRLTLDNPGFVKRYLKGELALLLHMRLFDIDIVAHLQRADRATEVCSADKAENTRVCIGHAGVHSCHVIARECPIFEPHCDSKQKTMLRDIVQLIELPEQVPDSVTTFVWFDFVDAFNRIFPQRELYFSTELGRFVFSGTLGYREIEFAQASSRPKRDWPSRRSRKQDGRVRS